jgi:3-hydroxyisobutyrate dehydrogenase-like beta-hydroxyacid dehydrogenase
MAVSLAQTSKPFLKSGQVYVDINATSPMTKEEVDKIISPVALFVDCAVMGPVPTYQHKVPVSVSGNGARVFAEIMSPFGMNITLMDAPAGAASASKMFRSIFMKGFVVLLLEMLTAAHKYKVEDDVLLSVKETLTAGPLLEVVNGLLGRGVIHSERREHEMDEVIATLDTLKVDGTMSKATKAKLRWCTELGLKAYFKGVPPKDFHEIFAAMDKTN